MKYRSLICLALLAFASISSIQAADDVPKAVAVPADEKGAKKSSGTPIEKVKSAARPLNVTADLTTSASIGGTLVEVDVLLIKTAFGEASVPLSEIAGIRFPQGDDVSTSVVMLNGDSITGATDIKMVTIDTDWGTAKVNGSAIRSILFVPNLQWTATPGISGKRWSLQDAKAPAAAQAGSSQPNSPQSSSTTNRSSSGTNTGSSSSSQPGTVFPSDSNRSGTFFSPQ